MRPETRYFLRRASEEAHRAIASEQPEAADVHEDLATLYSVKAVTLLEEEADMADSASPNTGSAADERS